jgi:hypothetical protein
MLTRLSSLRPVAAAALAASLAACGGGSPFQPTSVRDGGVSLTGTLLGSASASSSGVSAFAAADSHAFTVTVLENPDIVVEVGEDGVFTLRGLPDGGFTLVFTAADGTPLGELEFDGVLPNQEITITVALSNGDVELVEEQRNGIGHGDLEIQGNIDELVTVDPSGDSLLMIGGYPVVVRPGATAIREGNRALGVDELSAGDQVHVKGVFLELEPGQDPADQQVLAHEIILQQREEDDDDGEDDDAGDGDQKITICHKKKNTITISINAWPAHQAHGDTMGACVG